MTSSQRLARLRELVHNPVSPENSAALSALLASWPEGDSEGQQIAMEIAKATVLSWSNMLSDNSEALGAAFPQWTARPKRVSVRLCGGDTERHTPSADDTYVDAVFYGAVERFEAVCVEPRRARAPHPREAPDGVIWLVTPELPGGE